ncbi:MAG TPA: hypothetical protein VGW77_14380 [Candidatus Binatia bacterium]|nr:hypothetical protein [Candidatus Binatia bacterium]
MKLKPTDLTRVVRPKTTSIRTTFMDLLQELTNLTKDDTLVLAALKNIFDCHNVRLVRSLAPVRLVVTSRWSQRNRQASR